MVSKFSRIIILLTLFHYNNVKAQPEKVRGLWENKDSLRIGIYRGDYGRSYILTHSTSNSNIWDYNRRFRVRIIEDTLRFGNDVVSIRDTIPIDTVYFENFHDFKIITFTDSTLVLIPISKLSIGLLKSSDTIELDRIDYRLEKTVTFEKFILSNLLPKDYIFENEYDNKTSYYLEIDSNKNIFIEGNFYEPDGRSEYPYEYLINDSLSGKFTGTLPDSLYHEILHHLDWHAKFTPLEPMMTNSIDYYGIIVVYNKGKQKYMRRFDDFNFSFLISTINQRIKLRRVVGR